MRVSGHDSAMQAYRASLQTPTQSVQQQAPVSQISTPNLQKLLEILQQFIGNVQPEVLNDPPMMRYGMLPDPGNDPNPPLVMRYGVVPNTNNEPPADPPMVMKYGIFINRDQ